MNNIQNTMQVLHSSVPVEVKFNAVLKKEVMSDQQLRLFAALSVERALELLPEPRQVSRLSVELAKRYARGDATIEEVLAARTIAAVDSEKAWGIAEANWSNATSAQYYAARAAMFCLSVSDYSAAWDASWYACLAIADMLWHKGFTKDWFSGRKLARRQQIAILQSLLSEKENTAKARVKLDLFDYGYKFSDQPEIY